MNTTDERGSAYAGSTQYRATACKKAKARALVFAPEKVVVFERSEGATLALIFATLKAALEGCRKPTAMGLEVHLIVDVAGTVPQASKRPWCNAGSL